MVIKPELLAFGYGLGMAQSQVTFRCVKCVSIHHIALKKKKSTMCLHKHNTRVCKQTNKQTNKKILEFWDGGIGVIWLSVSYKAHMQDKGHAPLSVTLLHSVWNKDILLPDRETDMYLSTKAKPSCLTWNYHCRESWCFFLLIFYSHGAQRSRQNYPWPYPQCLHGNVLKDWLEHSHEMPCVPGLSGARLNCKYTQDYTPRYNMNAHHQTLH